MEVKTKKLLKIHSQMTGNSMYVLADNAEALKEVEDLFWNVGMADEDDAMLHFYETVQNDARFYICDDCSDVVDINKVEENDDLWVLIESNGNTFLLNGMNILSTRF